MESELFKSLGAALLVKRVQSFRWSVTKAARKAKVDAGVIGRIERGENYEVENLEKYAVALGHPLEWWLMKVISEQEAQRRASGEPFPSGKATGTDRPERERS